MFFLLGLLHIDKLTKAAAQNNRYVCTDGQEFIGEIFTRKIRHGHIGDDQVKCRGLGAKGLQGFEAVGFGSDIIAERLQHFLPQLCQSFFIINEQDAFTAGWKDLVHLWFRYDLLLNLREKHVKGGSFPWLAIDRDRATVALDDTLNHRKPQSGSFTYALSGEVWIEDPFHDCSIHAMPRIAYGKNHVRPFSQIGVPGHKGGVSEGIPHPHA